MARHMSRADRRRRVHLRNRSKVLGTPERPRLCVFKSLKHIYGQLVDDSGNRTLATVSSLKLDGKKLPNGGNVSAARDVGKELASKAGELGIKKVVFDRNGNLYTGRVKALAEAARKAGLKF
jgi:large subunit ribosomal protein L18